ncbi:MAG: DinB family protein [Ferruginibacter sp.]
MTKSKEEIAIKMVLVAWHSKVKQFDKLLSELSDEQLLKEVSPGRNRGIYILGHLTGLADHAALLLGFTKELAAPHLVKPFIQTPDKEINDLPAPTELRTEWEKAKNVLADHVAASAPGEWFQKHTSVSEEDFEKEPHRNKLNVMLSRASHLDYHLGQLIFLKNRK